jgi:hypothetical protein
MVANCANYRCKRHTLAQLGKGGGKVADLRQLA